MNGCNAGASCANLHVGNINEIMSLDTSIFNYLGKATQQHIIHTSSLNPKDPTKFSLAAPTRVSSYYRRVWEVAPSSECIIYDT